MEKIFFDSWESIIRTFIIGIFAYTGLIILLRISGKRTLSTMNAFDMIVTVALGSTLATVLLTKNVALADGLLAFALLIFLQLSITWISVRSKKVSELVKATPTLLVYKGKLIKEAMNKERITEAEILNVIRENGIGKLEEVDVVILETEGKLSVIKKENQADYSVLKDVRGVAEAQNQGRAN